MDDFVISEEYLTFRVGLYVNHEEVIAVLVETLEQNAVADYDWESVEGDSLVTSEVSIFSMAHS